MTVVTGYPDRWSFVFPGTVTYLDVYTMLIEFPADSKVRDVNFLGIQYDQGQSASNVYGLSDHISSITVEYIGSRLYGKRY